MSPRTLRENSRHMLDPRPQWLPLHKLPKSGPSWCHCFHAESGFSRYYSTKTEKLHGCQPRRLVSDLLTLGNNRLNMTFSLLFSLDGNWKCYLYQSYMHWLDINENTYKYLRLQKIKKKDLKLLFFFQVICYIRDKCRNKHLQFWKVKSWEDFNTLLCNVWSSMFRYHWYPLVKISCTSVLVSPGPTFNTHLQEPLHREGLSLRSPVIIISVCFSHGETLNASHRSGLDGLSFSPCPVSPLIAIKYLQFKHHLAAYLDNSGFSNMEIG